MSGQLDTRGVSYIFGELRHNHTLLHEVLATLQHIHEMLHKMQQQQQQAMTPAEVKKLVDDIRQIGDTIKPPENLLRTETMRERETSMPEPNSGQAGKREVPADLTEAIEGLKVIAGKAAAYIDSLLATISTSMTPADIEALRQNLMALKAQMDAIKTDPTQVPTPLPQVQALRR